MATKPDFKPEWATTSTTLPVAGNANKARTRATWRTVGLDFLDFATAQEFNWQFNNLYLWTNYFEEFTDDIQLDIDGLQSQIDTNTSNISTNTTNISTNTSNISTINSTAVFSGDNVSDLTNDATYQSLVEVNSLISTALEAYEDTKEPIGTVMYLDAATDPNTFKRGTWVVTAEGRFIVGQDTGDTDFDVIGETGGSKSHTHSVPHDGWNNPNARPGVGDGGKVIIGSGAAEVDEILESLSNSDTDNTTGSVSDITVPYQVMKIWKKTAL